MSNLIADVRQSTMTRTAALCSITFYSAIIYMLFEIRDSNCTCLSDWRDDFCLYFSFVTIALQLVTFALGDQKWYQKISPVVLVLNAVNVYALVSYLHKLSTDKCQHCETEEHHTAMRYVTYIWATLLTMVLVYIVIFLVTTMVYSRSSKYSGGSNSRNNNARRN